MMQSRLTALEQLGPSQFNLAMAAEVPVGVAAEMSELEGEYPCRQEAEAWEEAMSSSAQEARRPTPALGVQDL